VREPRTAAVVTVGSEILTGKVTDLNLSYIIPELRSLGVPLVLAFIVPDAIAAIADAVRYASARADVVITTGGVGPTHDDVTIPAIARAFGRALARSERLERAIRAYYGDRVNEDVLRMADVPEGAELLEEPHLDFPLLKVENVHVFPGSPRAFRAKFDAWKERLRQAPFSLLRIYLDADESEIAASLRHVEGAHPVAVGSYPKCDAGATSLPPAPPAGWRVLVTIEAKDAAAVDAAARDLLGRLRPHHLVRTEG
jgi:molybdenum cofactor synthesis domain-containing protein